MTSASRKVGLALSGGGFRAMAFGLGAMRALHDQDLLSSVRVVSGISGGSVLAAMWAYGPRDFDAFDLNVRQLLRKGLQAELVRRAFNPASMARSTAASVEGAWLGRPRAFSRTEALARALRGRGLDVPMDAVNRTDLDTVITATDLSRGQAVRFGSKASSSWSLGRITGEVTVADAVAASAAFPLLLPALVRHYEVEGRDGTKTRTKLALTDGGVYDNLGVTPLLPGRSTDHTAHVYDLDTIIVVDSGRGPYRRNPASYLPGRAAQTFGIAHGRAQDGTRSRLHHHAAELNGMLHIYLGTNDRKLPPVADLVPRETIAHYPTNFAKMPADMLEALSVRAEQITRTLAAEYLR